MTCDVAEDVLAGLHAWLLEKILDRRRGVAGYHAREGAAAAGDTDLAPRLILEH